MGKENFVPGLLDELFMRMLFAFLSTKLSEAAFG